MAFFTDQKERLYIRTFEEGAYKGEYIHDITVHNNRVASATL